MRQDRFFDSPGPGGIRNPKQRARGQLKDGIRLLEIPKDHIHQFAHFGYVHAMLLAQVTNDNGVQAETLVTGGGDGVVCLWDLDSDHSRPTLLVRLGCEREDAESILSMIREGQFLFTGRVDGEINVWDLETKQLLRVMHAFPSDVLTLSLGSKSLFGSSDSGFVKVIGR